MRSRRARGRRRKPANPCTPILPCIACRPAGWQRRIVPLDVSTSALTEAAKILQRRYPGIQLCPVRGDFTRHLQQLETVGRTAIVFLGSTIGNLGPEQRRQFFGSVRATLAE